LGSPKEVRPGNCKLESIAIAQRKIHVGFQCDPNNKEIYLTLVPPPGPSDALDKTRSFVILAGDSDSPPEGLVADLVKRLESADSVDWNQVGSQSDSLSLEYLPIYTRSEAEVKKYYEGLELYRHGNHAEALDIYVELAKIQPYNGSLGMVVATLAGGEIFPEQLVRLEKEATEHPQDALKQFMAGVGNHYRAHDGAETMEEKRQLYARAILYLDRVVDTYKFEPRVFIYLAVSHFRLGHQKKAEGFVERAITLGNDDPDAYYCRAEIFQRVNIERSLQDLDIYLGTMKKNMAGGAVASKSKLNRVREMRRHLQAVHRGEVEAKEIFDPMEAESIPFGLSRKTAIMILGWAPWCGAGLGLMILSFWAYRRRSNQGSIAGS